MNQTIRILSRRAVLLSAASACTLAAWAQPASLPQRNLLVQWRWSETTDRSAHEAAVRSGGVVVGTGGRVDAQGSVVLRSRERQDAGQGEQSVLVLNGARAGIGMAQAVPLQWVEVAVTPDGPAAVLRQAWTEAGQRLQVQPRWPGGSAPVTVEVMQQASTGSAGDSLVTSLRVPLDQWVTVARSGESRSRHEQGVLSSRDAQRQGQRELQMRISVP